MKRYKILLSGTILGKILELCLEGIVEKVSDNRGNTIYLFHLAN